MSSEATAASLESPRSPCQSKTATFESLPVGSEFVFGGYNFAKISRTHVERLSENRIVEEFGGSAPVKSLGRTGRAIAVARKYSGTEEHRSNRRPLIAFSDLEIGAEFKYGRLFRYFKKSETTADCPMAGREQTFEASAIVERIVRDPESDAIIEWQPPRKPVSQMQYASCVAKVQGPRRSDADRTIDESQIPIIT